MNHRNDMKSNIGIVLLFTSLSFAVTRCTPVAPSIAKFAVAPKSGGAPTSTSAPVSQAERSADPQESPILETNVAVTHITPPSPVPSASKTVSAAALKPNQDCIYALPADFAPNHEILQSVTSLKHFDYQWRLTDAEIYTLKNNGSIHKRIKALKKVTAKDLRSIVRISKAEASLNSIEEAPISLQLEGDVLTIELSKSLLYLNTLEEVGVATSQVLSECPSLPAIMEQMEEDEDLTSTHQEADFL